MIVRNLLKPIEKYLKEKSYQQFFKDMENKSEEIFAKFFGYEDELKVIKEVMVNQEANTKELRYVMNELLHKKDTTVSALERETGLSYNYINNLTSGVSEGSTYKLVAIAFALRLDLEELILLLKSSGKALKEHECKDRVIIACLDKGFYNFDLVDEALKQFCHEDEELF